MSLTTMIFLYSLSIVVGIVFVVYALAKYPYSKELTSDSRLDVLSGSLSFPTDEAVTLQFTDELPDASKSSQCDSSLPEQAKSGLFSKASGSLTKAFQTPLRLFKRDRSLPDETCPDRPIPDGIELDAKAVKGVSESTDNT